MKRKTPFLTPFLLVFLLFNAFVFAQKPILIKKLEAKLATAKIDTTKVNIHINIANAYLGNDMKLFDSHLKEAYALAKKINYVKVLNYCNNNKYDFMTSDNLKYEVKTEPASRKTNNFLIEFKGYR